MTKRPGAIPAFSYRMLDELILAAAPYLITMIKGVSHDDHSYYRSDCHSSRWRRILRPWPLVVTFLV